MKSSARSILRKLEMHTDELRAFGVERIGLFGSFLNGKPEKNSDIDVLVCLRESSFDKYMELKFFLEKLFHRKVDLVTEASLKPAMKYVRQEAVYVEGL
jgi:predicted nucleotidyltransferase